MTLQVAISRARDYVLMTGDRSAYALLAGGDEHGVPVTLPLPNKSGAITSHVVVGIGGCVAIAADFRRRIDEKIGPHDNFDACHEAAQETVRDLHADDRPGEEYEIPGGWTQTRGTIDEHFTLVMSGFRPDGTTAIVQCANTTSEEPFDDDDRFEFTATVPNGVPVDDILPHYVILATPTAGQAVNHAFNTHRTLARQHPTRVTANVQGILLRWRSTSQPPSLSEFACSTEDLDRCNEIYLDAVIASIPNDHDGHSVVDQADLKRQHEGIHLAGVRWADRQS